MSKGKEELVRVFKEAWHDADERGQSGHRVEAGIDAVLALLEPALYDEYAFGRYEIRLSILDRDDFMKHGARFMENNPYAVRARLHDIADLAFKRLMEAQ